MLIPIKMRKLFYCALLFTSGFATSYLIKTKHPEIRNIVMTDTIISHDTLFIRIPQPTESYIVRHTTAKLPISDSLFTEQQFSVNDTFTPDSATVRIPIKTKVYSDSTFRAVISGYEPRLDSLTIYPETKIVRFKPKKWTLGISAGVTATTHGIAPGITVGVTYSFISF